MAIRRGSFPGKMNYFMYVEKNNRFVRFLFLADMSQNLELRRTTGPNFKPSEGKQVRFRILNFENNWCVRSQFLADKTSLRWTAGIQSKATIRNKFPFLFSCANPPKTCEAKRSAPPCRKFPPFCELFHSERKVTKTKLESPEIIEK